MKLKTARKSDGKKVIATLAKKKGVPTYTVEGKDYTNKEFHREFINIEI